MDKAEYYRAVSRSAEKIRRYFESRSRDHEEIADLTQETIAALLESSRRYRDTCSFTTWIYSVCRNVYGKHVYYAVRRRKLDRVLQSEIPKQSEWDHGSEPVEAVEAEMRMAALGAALERLDAHDARLYRMYYVRRMSVAKVSELLGRSEGTVKWQLHRLRKRLRDAILGMNGHE